MTARGPAAARPGTQRINYGVGVVLVAAGGGSLRRTRQAEREHGPPLVQRRVFNGTVPGAHPISDVSGLDASRLRLPMRTHGGCDPSVMRWLVSLRVAKSTGLSLVDELHPWNVGVTMDWAGPFLVEDGMASQKRRPRGRASAWQPFTRELQRGAVL